jgi:phosphoglycerate dehydrogenase-like enzyme
MNQLPERLSFLVATDFDLAAIESLEIPVRIEYGGWVEDRIPYDPKEMIKAVNHLDIQVLVVEVEEVPGVVFQHCPSLEMVITLRANPVNVDLEAAQEAGVIVLHAPGRNARAVAELTLGLMLDVLRNTSRSYQEMKKGIWGDAKDDPYLRFRGRELSGKIVGLVGFGAIGRHLAKLLAGFDTEILAYDPYQSRDLFSEHGVPRTPLEELLGRSDLVSIHVPLSEETRDLLGSHELSLMKPHAYLINTARAAVVNKNALREALAKNTIAGAAFDVHHQEPPDPDDLLLNLPNFLYTPHIGGATIETIKRGSKTVMEDLQRILHGQEPRAAAVYPNKPKMTRGD